MAQVVGQSCGHCGENIAVIFHGQSCLGCERAYHQECYERAPGCIDCGPEPKAPETSAEDAENKGYELKAALGIVLLLVLLYGGAALVDVVRTANLPVVKIETSMGTIRAKLYEIRRPNTVANFLGLASGEKEWEDAKTKTKHKKPFYDGLTFHRIVKGFMIQGGCPKGDGTGGPGYKFRDELIPEIKHDKAGLLSMANSGRHTNGSQFFITLDKQPHLDGKHAVFGEVIEGMDVVTKMGELKTRGDKPVEPPKILRIRRE